MFFDQHFLLPHREPKTAKLLYKNTFCKFSLWTRVCVSRHSPRRERLKVLSNKVRRTLAQYIYYINSSLPAAQSRHSFSLFFIKKFWGWKESLSTIYTSFWVYHNFKPWRLWGSPRPWAPLPTRTNLASSRRSVQMTLPPPRSGSPPTRSAGAV